MFTNYIYDIYKIKSNSINATQKAIAKSLLNNLLERFGIQLEKYITEVVSSTTFNRLSLMKKNIIL